MKKPNAVLHMMSYGMLYGFILAILYIWGIAIFVGIGYTERTMVDPGIGFIFGAVPGAIMGFIEGWILWFLKRRIESSPEPDAYTFEDTHNRAIIIFGLLTFVGMTSLSSLVFGFGLPSLNEAIWWMILIGCPGLIAGGAAAYTVHRYMSKLWAWANVGKAKNDHKLKNQLAYDDATDDLLIAETEFKQDNSSTV